MARQQEDRQITRTHVLVDSNAPADILGFYTVNYCEILAPVGSALYGRYSHPLCGLKLSRMAVDKRVTGQGYGGYLLIHAIKDACLAHAVSPLVGLLVDAKDDGARSFYEKYGFRQVNDDRLSLWLPMQDCQAINTQAT